MYSPPSQSYSTRAGATVFGWGMTLIFLGIALLFLAALGCAAAIVFFTNRLNSNKDNGPTTDQNKEDVNTIYALSIVILVALVLVAFIRLIGWFIR